MNENNQLTFLYAFNTYQKMVACKHKNHLQHLFIFDEVIIVIEKFQNGTLIDDFSSILIVCQFKGGT